ncbi:MAG: urea ABC transporter permease subunit UrtB [Hyphomicrobiales bacterium]|nr:MAG: urea ABC transporter permease subunit UrtB [Hyphomicrobiales bacterium]
MGLYVKNLFLIVLLLGALIGSITGAAFAQDGASPIQTLLQSHSKKLKRSSAKSIGPVIEAIRESGLPQAQNVLEKWRAKELWFRKSDDLLIFVETNDKKTYSLLDIATGQSIGSATKKEIKQIKPNSGVRGLIDGALVFFRLTDSDKAVRISALDSLGRDPKAAYLPIIRTALSKEKDAGLKTRMSRMERILIARFETDTAKRVVAIESFADDMGIDVRAALNPLLSSKVKVAMEAPDMANLARDIFPGVTIKNDGGTASEALYYEWLGGSPPELSMADAYILLVKAKLAPADVSIEDQKTALISNIKNGQVGGVAIADLNTDKARATAYRALVREDLAAETISVEEQHAVIEEAFFYGVYDQKNMDVVRAARTTLASINSKVSINTFFDLFLDAMSLASIYFLAAIGLAITFGVMRVINMAHGEFIMMGAYTGYVVQQFIPNYTLSIIVAVPAAFAVTFAAGVVMERLVIRHLYNRPLETLLATFGISICLQQLAKNIFGTQARPLTAPDWLDGALVINEVVSISWIRVAIFVLGILFFVLLLFILNKTRLGLETRAVTQNPRMAASMGINIDRVYMLTFGLGSGIAGIAGVAIGLFAKVTSELGSDYIVQSFMTVVVGGVGNIWGTLAGATLIGFLQKNIEFFNPSNTLAAQTYMIIFIIIFIQFRPRGIIALKGRAAEA